MAYCGYNTNLKTLKNIEITWGSYPCLHKMIESNMNYQLWSNLIFFSIFVPLVNSLHFIHSNMEFVFDCPLLRLFHCNINYFQMFLQFHLVFLNFISLTIDLNLLFPVFLEMLLMLMIIQIQSQNWIPLIILIHFLLETLVIVSLIFIFELIFKTLFFNFFIDYFRFSE